MGQASKRIEWVDLLKGIAILWLVVYHMHVFDGMRSPVPVFFFLSGLFFSEGKSFRSFVGKKVIALLVPFIFFFILGIGSFALKSIILNEAFLFPPLWKFTTLIPHDAEVVNPLGVGAIWFLVSLFEIYLIYYLLRKITKNKWWLWGAAILLWLVSCVTMQWYAHGSLFYLFYTFGFCIYFIMAHLLRDKVLYEKFSVWLLFTGVCMYGIKFLDISNLLEISGMGGVIMSRFIGLVSTVGLIVILIWLCKTLSSISWLLSSQTCKFMLFEGRNSLTILGVHMLFMGVAGLVMKHFIAEGVLYFFVLFLIVLVFSNISILIFNRYTPFLVNHNNNNIKKQ